MPKINIYEDLIHDKYGIEDCNLPFRESFRTRQKIAQGWYFGDRKSPRINGHNAWRFVSRIAENNIGKSFDGTYSYFCRKAKKLDNYDRWIFLEQFEGRYSRYIVDDEGRIRVNWRRNYKTKPLYFVSNDYEETWLLRVTVRGYRWDKEERRYVTRLKTYDRVETHKGGYSNWKVQGSFIKVEPIKLISTKGIKLEFDNKKDPKYQRFVQEHSKTKRKLNREKQRELKLKEYSFLTKEEQEIKKGKERDLITLYSHGFDSESFKGEPYHGRKNKKK